MKKFFPRIALILFSFVFSDAPAAEKEVVYWGLPNVSSSLKEVVETTRPYAESGYLMALIKNALPNYKHQFFSGNLQRILGEVKRTSNTCFAASLYRADRESYAYMTSYALLPAPVLVVKKEMIPQMPMKKGKVELEKLLKQKNLKGLATEGRSFGHEVDKVLKKAESPFITRFTSDFLSDNLFVMVAKGRGDYTFEHAYYFEHYQAVTPAIQNLASLSIAEAPGALELYILCSRSPLGKTVIQQADAAIRSHIGNAEYREKVLKSHTSFDKESAFMKAIDSFIAKRAKKPEVL